MKKKNKRLITILIFMAFFAFGCAILLFNLRENLIFFYSPTEVFEKQIETTQIIRVGGMVKDKSLVKKYINLFSNLSPEKINQFDDLISKDIVFIDQFNNIKEQLKVIINLFFPKILGYSPHIFDCF